MEGIGTDVADRGLQRIGLLGAIATRLVVGALGAAAGAKAAVRADASALHEAVIEGLLQRIRNRAGVAGEIIIVVVFVVARRPIGVGMARYVAAIVGPSLVRLGVVQLRVELPARLAAGLRIRLRLRPLTVVGARVAWPAIVTPLRAVVAAALSRIATPAVTTFVGAAFALHRRAGGEAANRTHVGIVQIDPDTALEAVRQHDRAIPDANEPAHGQVDSLEKFPHLAVATFGDDDAIPSVQSFAAAIGDRLEG
ncbi:MAG: hypothetical protein ABI281_04475, partial [Caldimonas sp.]